MVGRDERRNAYNQLVRVGTGACSVWFEHAVRTCRSRLCVAREVFRRCSRGAVMPGTNQRHTLQADLRGLSPLLRRATLFRRFRGGACHALGCRQRLHDGGTSMAVLPRRSRRRRLSCFASWARFRGAGRARGSRAHSTSTHTPGLARRVRPLAGLEPTTSPSRPRASGGYWSRRTDASCSSPARGPP